MNAKLKLPEIGDIITTKDALKLCQHFNIDYLINRLQKGVYNSWIFDGCSGIPDALLGLFTGCNWKDITFKCCLPHDLGYAYGDPGNKIERGRVDLKFKNIL